MLADNELAARLGEFDVATDNPNFPFDPESQIQPCSIDLRLSDLLWRPRGFRCLDLSDKDKLFSNISKSFSPVRINRKKGLIIRPREFLLGRTYEKFSIPDDLVGRLAGRSSLGRLGLSVTAPSNFINPAWRGHMPLMLINHGPYSIRIFPYLGIVQLYFFSLTSRPQHQYGDDEVGSKYVDDDGGPSKYWLDNTIRVLRDNLNLRTVSPEVERYLNKLSQELDEQTRKRFCSFIEKSGIISDREVFVSAFIRSEQRRPAMLLLLLVVLGIPVAILTSWWPDLIATGLLGWAVSGLLIALALGLSWWIYASQVATSTPPSELRQIAREVANRV